MERNNIIKKLESFNGLYYNQSFKTLNKKGEIIIEMDGYNAITCSFLLNLLEECNINFENVTIKNSDYSYIAIIKIDELKSDLLGLKNSNPIAIQISNNTFLIYINKEIYQFEVDDDNYWSTINCQFGEFDINIWKIENDKDFKINIYQIDENYNVITDFWVNCPIFKPKNDNIIKE